MTGLSDLVQAHVRVLNDRFPDRSLSETVATAQLYWNGTKKQRLQLKRTRPTATKVAYATQDQRTTTERPLAPVRTPPSHRAAVQQANPADICYNCIANHQEKTVSERREAEPPTQKKNKSDWLFDMPRSYYWLRVSASSPASQSTCLAGVTQSHCNPQ